MINKIKAKKDLYTYEGYFEECEIYSFEEIIKSFSKTIEKGDILEWDKESKCYIGKCGEFSLSKSMIYRDFEILK